jgi:hypothetical protein
VFQGEQFACRICAAIAFEVSKSPSVNPTSIWRTSPRPEGGKDITTLIDYYQQPDEETLRSVVEFVRLTH